MTQPVENPVSSQRKITRAHIVQSVIAGLYILFAFGIMHFFHGGLAITSLGASTFIAFSFPNAPSSKPKILIGGYCAGIVSGLFCALLAALFRESMFFYIPISALAVILAMLLMTILRVEHPPAAAMAIVVAIDTSPVTAALVGLGCVAGLCLAKELLRKNLRNLS